MSMAVSHQWFFQWSPPSGLIADINQRFEHLNTDATYRGNNFGQQNEGFGAKTKGLNYDYSKVSPYIPSTRQTQVTFPVNSHLFNAADKKKPLVNNDKTNLAGLTLWMTMLSVARGQAVNADTDTPPFSTLYKWKKIDFEFPSSKHRRHAISARKYIPENVLPLGIEIWGPRLFITLPSWREGIPATLATVTRSGGLTSPPLKPYPNWNFHRAFNGNNCSGLTSVFRIKIDDCERLWVLDSGQVDSQDKPKQLCPPSIAVFDLRTDKLLARYKIPKRYVLQDSLFSNIIVDSREPGCSNLHVYIADTWRFGLLVFREIDQKFWRFSHHLFYPDPLASNFTLHGLNFQWSDGVFGLALGLMEENNDRKLYFHPLSSYNEFYVYTSVLQRSERVNSSASDFEILGENRGFHGQASTCAVDRRGVMFYGLVSRDSIGCWDTRKLYKRNTLGVVAKNEETLVYPNDIKIDREARQSIWVITNRLPMYQANLLDSDDYNYRVLYANTEEAVRFTVCDDELSELDGRRLKAHNLQLFHHGI